MLLACKESSDEELLALASRFDIIWRCECCAHLRSSLETSARKGRPLTFAATRSGRPKTSTQAEVSETEMADFITGLRRNMKKPETQAQMAQA